MKANWSFQVGQDRLLVVHGGKIGVRSEYNGILFLNTILQTPVADNMQLVQIELMRSEV